MIAPNREERLLVIERQPSICSIFDTLWQQRIMAAFDARPKRYCFGNPHSVAVFGNLSTRLVRWYSNDQVEAYAQHWRAAIFFEQLDRFWIKWIRC
jgi:hypothetical protein